MGYNLREAPWGYENNDPTNDVGFGFRQAVSHLVDKRSIVQNLLQNFGVIGWGFISPANTFWYNDNIPKPAFDLATANAILDDLATPGGAYDDPRYTLDPPGPCHKDNDGGCRSLPLIGNADFEILTPQADYDPVRASAGAMIADAMRQVGINAGSRPTAFGEIVARITIHDFDLFILGWRIGGTDPDYLYPFFSCSNGFYCNIMGYNNAEFEEVMGASRAEMNREVRQGLIFRAQEILARDRPAEPLYYRTNIEGYRQDRYVNWSVVPGTIWNFWSLIGIHPPSSFARPTMTIHAPSATIAEAMVPISFSVHDSTGVPVSGATVAVEVTAGAGESPGVLIGNGQQGEQILLLTNVAGSANASYSAPSFSEGARQVVLTATARHPYFGLSSMETTILTVIGAYDLAFLRLDVDLPTGDITSPGSIVPIRIKVRDRWGAVGDATVDIEAIPDGIISPSNGSSQALQTVTAEFPSVGAHSLSFRVTKEGHRETWAVVDIGVVERSSLPPAEPPAGGFPDDFPMAAASLVFLAAMAASTLSVWVLRGSWRSARRR